VRLALVPKSSEFYELFAQAGANAVEVARKAETLFREHPNSPVTQSEIKALEHVGDRLTYEIIQTLNTRYVTPFDREDIYDLATTTDDVVDHIDHACDLLGLYNVETPSGPSLEQCRILVAATEKLATALSDLKARKAAQPAVVELKRLEDEGDRVVRDAIAGLFHDPRIDPLIVIRWKDIYEALEDALDACETAANVVGNIIVKNA
jgi:predicted phosphate transport protein (TIGR00153 family)